jgi:hypothetical protein
VYVGGLVAFDTDTPTSVFDRFFDIVVTASAGDLSIVANADYNMDVAPDGSGVENAAFWGVSLAAGYSFSDQFGVALRGEYLKDAKNRLYATGGNDGPDGLPDTTDDVAPPPQSVSVITGTLTLDYKPTGTNNLVLRLDNRIESSNREIYFNGDGDPSKKWFTTVAGVVVNTDG